MATKKGFLLLNNQIEIIETLTDEQAGQLLKAFYDYNIGNEIKLKGLMKTVFNNFKVVFDENEQKYQEICENINKQIQDEQLAINETYDIDYRRFTEEKQEKENAIKEKFIIERNKIEKTYKTKIGLL